MKQAVSAIAAVALFVLMAFAGVAEETAEEQLPGVDCLSPQLTAFLDVVSRDEEPIELTAAFMPENLFYGRDYSVLKDMMKDLSIHVFAGGDTAILSLSAGTAALENLTMTALEDNRLAVRFGEETVVIPSPVGELSDETSLQAIDIVRGVIARREELQGVANWLGQQKWAKELNLTQENSQDGSAPVKLSFSGNLMMAGDPWKAEGWITRPQGNAPKDNAEITLTKDEQNHLTFTAVRHLKSSVKSKEKEGSVSSEMRVQMKGTLEGYAVSADVRLNVKNTWVRNENGALTENIRMKLNSSYRNKNPAVHGNRLDSVDLYGESTLLLSNGGRYFENRSNATMTMAGLVALEGSVALNGRLGSPEPEPLKVDENTPRQEFDEWASDAIMKISRSFYQKMDPSVIKKMMDGLN